MKIGIVGLPNVGKSSLFNCLTSAKAESANYPFCTIEPNVGIVAVPDERLNVLAKMYNSKKITPAVIEFVDIAGLVKGASKGEGLGNQFLSNIRETESIIHVIRCFKNENVIHVDGNVDGIRDLETISLELIFADIAQVEKKLNKERKNAKADKKKEIEVKVLENVLNCLNSGLSPKTLSLNDDELKIIKDLNLLSMKPVIYVANIEEENILEPEKNEEYMKLKKYFEKEESYIIPLSIKTEEELASLEADDKKEMIEALGLDESGLDKLIKKSYDILGLMSYLTAGEEEVRAWTIKKGSTAPQAAGKIHTDFEKGFIKAEIVSYNDLVELGTYSKAKEKGKVRLEGKEYVMQEGDIALFRFNV